MHTSSASVLQCDTLCSRSTLGGKGCDEGMLSRMCQEVHWANVQDTATRVGRSRGIFVHGSKTAKNLNEVTRSKMIHS